MSEGERPPRKNDLLKLPDDLAGNLRALLATPPVPHGTAGSRKAAPKLPKKAKKKQRRRNAPMAPVGTYAYESAPVKGPRKRKAKR